jgi:hypothetical protein
MMTILKEAKCRSRSGSLYIPRPDDTICCFGGCFKVISVTPEPDEGDFKVVSLKLEQIVPAKK